MLSELNYLYILAIGLLLACWFFYPLIFKLLGKNTLNTRLFLIRYQWIKKICTHERSPFDAILLGHIISAVSFFGSATLIVLAGLLSILFNLESTHTKLADVSFLSQMNLTQFSSNMALLGIVLTISFFSFIYALRKLIYSIALMGALPQATSLEDLPKGAETQIESTTTIITEALKTFNFGIRGYYYAIAAIFLLVSPWACIFVTITVTSILVIRQVRSHTVASISNFLEVTEKGSP